MKIAVIFTGGTIGTVVKDGWMVSEGNTRYRLLENSGYSNEIEFVTYTPYTVLSENLTAKQLNMLQKEVERVLETDCDGIIITHGTDTLQYSAVAVEYAFCNSKKPIVFVSAAYPLEDERTNGYSIFIGAVEFIKRKINGVFVSYRNCGQDITNIHIPTRLLQHSECSGDLYCIGQPFAFFDGRSLTVNGGEASETKGLGIVEYTSDSHILTVDSRPGDAFAYSLDGVSAVIIKPYHSATLNTESSELASFCRRAVEKSIPVFTVNVRPGVTYESVKAFEKLGIIPLPYSTYISAYTKIWAAVSLCEDVTSFAKKEIAGEFVVN